MSDVIYEANKKYKQEIRKKSIDSHVDTKPSTFNDKEFIRKYVLSMKLNEISCEQ